VCKILLVNRATLVEGCVVKMREYRLRALHSLFASGRFRDALEVVQSLAVLEGDAQKLVEAFVGEEHSLGESSRYKPALSLSFRCETHRKRAGTRCTER